MTNPKPQAQNRNYPRAPISIRVQYRDPQRGQKEAFTGVLGGGGLFLDTVAPLPVGTAVHLEFELPGRPEAIRVDGLVVWVREGFDPKGYSPGMGIQFGKVAEADRQFILNLVMAALMGRPEYEV